MYFNFLGSRKTVFWSTCPFYYIFLLVVYEGASCSASSTALDIVSHLMLTLISNQGKANENHHELSFVIFHVWKYFLKSNICKCWQRYTQVGVENLGPVWSQLPSPQLECECSPILRHICSYLQISPTNVWAQVCILKDSCYNLVSLWCMSCLSKICENIETSILANV